MASAQVRAATPWLFSAKIDLTAFLGSALVSLLLLAWGHYAGLLHSDTPEWAWVPFVLLVDVAHVYATAFRTYFDRDEFVRRPLLYVGVPLVAFIIGVALYSEGSALFWRVLAYFAVFHFVRQQYGWVAMYRARANDTSSWGKFVDTATIYAATVYPLLHWHGSLPRNFWWFVQDDFHALPKIVADIAKPLYWTLLSCYALRAIHLWRTGQANPGKDVVVATTAVCWYVGIISFNSDYAFTVTNVIIHGVPYIVLVFAYWIGVRQETDVRPRPKWQWLIVLLASIWLLAYVEELIWHRAVWHDRGYLFGSTAKGDGVWLTWVVPLLAVPQITHYVLDGFIWRRQSNPRLRVLSRSN